MKAGGKGKLSSVSPGDGTSVCNRFCCTMRSSFDNAADCGGGACLDLHARVLCFEQNGPEISPHQAYPSVRCSADLDDTYRAKFSSHCHAGLEILGHFA